MSSQTREVRPSLWVCGRARGALLYVFLIVQSAHYDEVDVCLLRMEWPHQQDGSIRQCLRALFSAPFCLSPRDPTEPCYGISSYLARTYAWASYWSLMDLDVEAVITSGPLGHCPLITSILFQSSSRVGLVRYGRDSVIKKIPKHSESAAQALLAACRSAMCSALFTSRTRSSIHSTGASPPSCRVGISTAQPSALPSFIPELLHSSSSLRTARTQ
jgi:hypothetical protein